MNHLSKISKFLFSGLTMAILAAQPASAAQLFNVTLAPVQNLVSGSFKINRDDLRISEVVLTFARQSQPNFRFEFNDPSGYLPVAGQYNFADPMWFTSAVFSGVTLDFPNNTGNVALITAQQVMIFDNIYLLFGAQNASLTLGQVAAPVPEPSAYALMALGCLGIGAMSRRRRQMA